MSKLAVMIVLGLALGMAGPGCASYTKTVKVEERAQPAPRAEPSPQAATVSTTTTIERRPRSRGLLSRSVHLIGQVLALPFRLVSGLLEIIF